MPVRPHPITGEPILYAPDRAGRPNAFAGDAATCPFCPGHESQTPPTIAAIGDPWRVRAFANKYPAVEGHEVIVDSSRHDATFDTIDNAAEVIGMFIARYRAHANATHVSVFKNDGERAGASIEHIHSQVIPLNFVPPRIERHVAAFNAAKRCPLCSPLEHVIEESRDFVRIAPYGSQQSYEQWIVPKRHQQDFTTLTDSEVESLAAILRSAVRAAKSITAAQNVLFMNFRSAPATHFYVDVFPRLTSIAGFELATGTFIDIIDPASAAVRLR